MIVSNCIFNKVKCIIRKMIHCGGLYQTVSNNV